MIGQIGAHKLDQVLKSEPSFRGGLNSGLSFRTPRSHLSYLQRPSFGPTEDVNGITRNRDGVSVEYGEDLRHQVFCIYSQKS
jgi:hypothetical protein